MVFTKKLLITLCVLSFISYSIQINYCGGRISDPDLQLNNSEMNSLCSLIKSDDRFLFNVQRSVGDSSINYDNNYYTNDSITSFTNRCSQFNICKTGFLVSVYNGKKKVRIVAGSAVSQVATVEQRQVVINFLKPYLAKNDYFNAFSIAFQKLKGFKPKTYTKTTTTITRTPKTVTYTRSGSDIGSTILAVLIIIVIFVLICYCIGKQRDNQGEVITTRNYNNAPQAKPEAIYNHILNLENLINQTKTVSPMIRVDNCLICFNNITYNQPTSEASGLVNNNPSDDVVNTRFECDHIYHTACLCAKKVNFCLLCKSADYSTPSMKIPNRSNFQIVTEVQLNTMIKNLKFLYSKDQIVSYTTTYPDQYRSHNTVIIVDDYTYMPYGYGGYGYGGYGYGGGYYDPGYNQGYNAGYTTTKTEYVESGIVDGGVIDAAGGDYGGGDGGDYGGGDGGDYGGGDGGDY